ncbi:MULTISPECIES: sigma-54-dependent transcriptional regulator [Rhodopirellula]|uniref:Sigma-54-dependent Fis family transcriptional regulator n=2 Tax=Rhodopirellula bahusiensis TaxID=2014065 RepID=A0A2G1W219_9BACT|nr:sigma-54 dependent transcriptional regulator [Rhodopirellula bahusiensis]PHQ33088.1 sigma-54-dependent Fis family transcriptional regulator [Rhodopirellula bahusiensis]|tara:strand:+ start:13982 stop:15439 length:1458 start_codon:yes stop_codon:yes gene_type:complete
MTSDLTAATDSPAEPPDRSKYRLLVVDNEAAHARAMTESLEKVGYVCEVATSGPDAAALIQRETFDIIITDMVMNDVDGMKILALANERLPECEVVMVTGHATVPIAVEAMQLGAFNFLEKPITPSRLRAIVEKAAENVELRRTNTELMQRLDERFGFEGIIYTSKKMQTVIDRLRRIAATDATVLITGESGTGKEMVAQAIHQNSPRKNKRIVALNTRAVSENLVESELFGHVKGSFTDAVSDREGAFEYANGGSLFLDEVGDMPMSTQIKLLRVLEESQITRVGGNKSIKVNVRLISATNRPLEEMIDAGTFRNDLYFRLKVVTIELPPLRERRDDVIALMDHFRKMFLRRHGKSSAHFTPAVTKKFFAYDWPGNIRQLRNFVETMVVLDTDGSLDEDDLPPELIDDAPQEGEESQGPALIEGNMNFVGRPLAEIERWAIEETLKLTGNNREEAAKILQIGARTLYRRLDQYKKDEDEAEAKS